MSDVLTCDWRALAEHVRSTVGHVDALIVDAPYDDRTHGGHDDGAAPRDRRSISYAPWDAKEIDAFVDAWSPITRGWMVSITCDGLLPAWRDAFARQSRMTFAAVPAIERAAMDRKCQDGPASWTTFVAVARPRGSKWIGGWQPLSYYLGPRENKPAIGGKPVWLMSQILEDYTRSGDLVCDPCCGAGTTLVAAKMLGRRWIGGDIDPAHADLARERLRDLPTVERKGTLALPWGER